MFYMKKELKYVGLATLLAGILGVSAGCYGTYSYSRRTYNPPVQRSYRSYSRGGRGSSQTVIRDRHGRIIRRHVEIWKGPRRPRHRPRGPYRRR